MADLKFDIDEIKKMKKLCDDLINGPEGIVNKTTELNGNLEDLRNKWNTPAGRKFFQDLEDDWSDQVAQYTKIVGAVSELLQEAITQYEPVKDAAKNLTI